ncbi:glycosyltransferase family 4 protein [Microbulbifer taiwanensis]|uniref:glycosyltransferase family 4 protein n=1 Tax=Microbulbifer taiwanensis TaxID=986746 RepID=UPI0036064F63
MRNYIVYCMRRDNYRLSHEEASGVFLDYIAACEMLGIDKRYIRINTKHGYLSDVLEEILGVLDRRDIGRKCVLHFASVFSAPSETFIYDLLVRMDSDGEYENFILCDERKLSSERPFQNAICVPWSDFRPEVRNEIYKYILEYLSPVALIAHFALNEWKLSVRLASLGIKIPTLSMTHGIDVFMLKSNAEYRRYILEDFCSRTDTKFTAVSNYLVDELVKNGVPRHKVERIYNTANPEFYRNRKIDSFFKYDRQLNILAVGRCIPLKGHSDLLIGLGWFVNNCCLNTKLTIVYGRGDECLNDLKQQLLSLKLQNHVEFIPFVDFTLEKSFFTNFDIFVQPSRYSNDILNRSESFGVSVLEAIFSGLPVITTDAGGLPEVLGRNSDYGRVVPHGDGIEIGKALKDFYENPETFTDNVEYARERFEYFSEGKQLASLKYELHRLTAPEVKVAMFTSSTAGGAGYAAFRLFRGLRDQTAIAPSLFAITHNGDKESDVRIVRHPSGNNEGWFARQNPLNSRPGFTIFTIDHSNIGKGHLLEMVDDCDVINLHWTARFLSVDNIAFLSNLNKPIVMTVRDMQPITGGCHFFHGCEQWKADCSGCPQLIDNFSDFPSKVLKKKRNSYNFSNITLVALSEHTRRILQSAPLFNDCRIEVIPNSIETDVFSPVDKINARKALGLPLDKRIIGYIPSYSSEVKGYKEAKEAFDILDQMMGEDKPIVMLVGDKTPANESICLETVSLGFVSDNAKLALAYAAADVVIVPSREETFSNTTAESISCGTPVVGCKTGAIPDLVQDGITGVAVEVGDPRKLAIGISKVLRSPPLSESCRKFALEHLEFSLQARKYDMLFHELVSESVRNRSAS